MGNYLSSFFKGIASLAKGLGITFSYLFRKPITVQYPEKRVELPLRFRGRLVLPVDPRRGPTAAPPACAA